MESAVASHSWKFRFYCGCGDGLTGKWAAFVPVVSSLAFQYPSQKGFHQEIQMTLRNIWINAGIFWMEMSRNLVANIRLSNWKKVITTANTTRQDVFQAARAMYKDFPKILNKLPVK